LGKELLFIERIRKHEAARILNRYHYLKDISKGFRVGWNFGLFRGQCGALLLPECEGVCIFTGLPVPEITVGAFGLSRENQDGLFELSRLCLHPEIQRTEHNIASWFATRCIRQLRKSTNVRAIISYADSSFHAGVVYAAMGFQYCGLTDQKFDYLEGNIVKYVSRYKHKNGLEDLKKAKWYLERLIDVNI